MGFRLIRLDSLEQFAAVKLSDDGGAIGGPVVVPQAAQVTLQFTLESGIVAHCVLYGRYAGGFTATVTNANSIKSTLTTGAAWTALAAHLAPSTSFAFVTIRDVNSPGQALIASNTAGAPGTSTGTALPSEVSAVLTKRTAQAGPAFRGRMYVPGFATTALGAGNVIAAAALTALNNWGATVNGALSAGGFTHVLGLQARAAYIGTSGTSHPARAATTVDVLTVSASDNHWDTQRRRGLR